MDLAAASTEARKILADQGLNNWGVLFEDDPRFLGVCRYEQKHICLQTNHVNRATSFRDIFPTVLHEVAHALTPGDGHGAKFHAKVRELIAYYVFGNS